jgi:hypothetical protein
MKPPSQSDKSGDSHKDRDQKHKPILTELTAIVKYELQFEAEARLQMPSPVVATPTGL